jgi:probable phosphomutase (TIGR03848 family)
MSFILLIRHGENNLVGKRLAGRLPDVHLNDKGSQQAEVLRDLLSTAPIKAIYTSPLERAVETAQPLANSLNLTVIQHPGLLEVNFGRWQGKTIKQMHRLKLWKIVHQQPSQMRFPDGESFAEAQQRMVACLEEINQAWEENDLIACVSHSDSIRLVIAHFLAMPLDAFQRIAIDTASLTLLHLGKERPVLVGMNQRAHFEWPKPPEMPPEKPGPSTNNR